LVETILFEIGVSDEFEAAHSLSGDFGPATRLHGHTYRVEVRIESPGLDPTGTFYDLGRLRTDLRAVLDRLHYRNLNEVPGLAGTNTTAEELARFILTGLRKPVKDAGVFSLKVTVWESPSSFASYRETFT
jgi:6-pyruvoyltetrahydropterin/6-carboxytetrahydropterin synthase